MSDIGLKEVHIGEAIDQRRKDIKMSKSELARKIGMRQQHINKLLDSETIDTGKLIQISRTLSFNFFSLYSTNNNNVSAFLSSIALGNGDATTMIGDASIASQLQLQAVQIEDMSEKEVLLKDQIETLKDQVSILKSQLKFMHTTMVTEKEKL